MMESAVAVEDKQGVLKAQELKNDDLITCMLQLELEEKLNFDLGSDETEEEKLDIHDLKEWDRFDLLEKQIRPVYHRGYKKVTKHNIVMNKSKNGYKLLQFPPAFQTCKRRISSKNFQSFNMDSTPKHSKRHQPRDNRGEFIISESKIDKYARYVIYSLISDGCLKRVNSIVNVSKRAVILHADCNPLYPNVVRKLPKECVIKVFQANFTEKETTEYTIQSWAKKEMSALKRLERNTVCCPQPIICKNHVVVMSFIGEQRKPAPKIKEVNLRAEEYIIMYEEVVEGMKKMYDKKNIIHGNLSENTILWHNNHCYFIDFSLSLERDHECGFSYLYRDCITIMKFFEGKGIQGMFRPDELFKYITGVDY